MCGFTHATRFLADSGPLRSYNDWMSMSGFWMIWLVYLPCLVMVLRRPNVAPADDPRVGQGGLRTWRG